MFTGLLVLYRVRRNLQQRQSNVDLVTHIEKREEEEEACGEEGRSVTNRGSTDPDASSRRSKVRAMAATWSSGASTQQVTQPEDHRSLVLPHHLSINATDLRDSEVYTDTIL